MLRNDAVWVHTTATPEHGTAAVPCNIRFVTDRPFTVRFEFANPGGDWVVWEFARALLLDGLTGPAGEGDVRFWPEPGDPGTVALALRNESRHLVLRLPRADLERAADAMEQLVPEGREAAFIDWDTALASLTTGGDPW